MARPVVILKRTSTSSTASGLGVMSCTFRIRGEFTQGNPRSRTSLCFLSAHYRYQQSALHVFSRRIRAGPGADLRRPTGDYVVVGTGNLFNGIRVAGKDSPHGRAIYAADTNNLQPRIGAAWEPGGAVGCSCAPGTACTSMRLKWQCSFRMCRVLVVFDPFRTDVS